MGGWRWIAGVVAMLVWAWVASAEPEGLADTPAGRRLKWVVRVINGEERPGAVEFAARFTERFKETEPIEKVREGLAGMRSEVFAGDEVRVIEVEGNSTEEAISAFIEGGHRRLAVFVAADGKTERISSLRFDRAGYSFDDVRDFEGLGREVGKGAAEVSFGVYEVVVGGGAGGKGAGFTLDPIHQVHDDRMLNVASGFKVLVLGALVEAVGEGAARWEEGLAIREEWKSLPAGVMQNEAAGKEFALEEYARRLIGNSDNTAADHLVERLSRSRVEEHAARIGEDVRNRPFLTTREFFRLKLAEEAEAVEAYEAGDRRSRLGLLGPEGALAGVKVERWKLQEWREPRRVGTVGWFASARGLAKQMGELLVASRGSGGEAVGRVLFQRRGIRLDEDRWPVVGYVGGAEPGVLSMTWLMRSDEARGGRWYVMSATWNDGEKVLEESKLVELVRKGLEILDRHVEGSKGGGNGGAGGGGGADRRGR